MRGPLTTSANVQPLMHPWNRSRGRLSAVSVLLIALRLALSAPLHARPAEPQARAAGRKGMATTINQVPIQVQSNFWAGLPYPVITLTS